MQAWSVVDKAVRMVGPYQSVVFDDPIIHRTLDDMGGWIKLCNTGREEDYKFQGIEFARRYRAYVISGGVGADYPRYLIGMAECENGSRGLKTSPPMLIGNQESCQRVLLGGSGTTLRVTQAPMSVAKLMQQAKLLGKDHD
jgi:hypothetical protein